MPSYHEKEFNEQIIIHNVPETEAERQQCLRSKSKHRRAAASIDYQAAEHFAEKIIQWVISIPFHRFASQEVQPRLASIQNYALKDRGYELFSSFMGYLFKGLAGPLLLFQLESLDFT